VDSEECSPSPTHPVTDLTLKVADGGGPDLRRSRFGSYSWIRRASKSGTADLHVDHWSVMF